MKYIYIAGPYTKGDSVINVRNAINVAEDLIDIGLVPFIPHLSHLWHLINPHEIAYWYQYDNGWLLKCDVVLRLPGESKGADAECALAKENNIPVFYSFGDFKAALDRKEG